MINIVINLFGGQAYEITDRYTAPRSSSAQRYRSDPWYTSSLIQRFPLELHDWLRLMEKVRHRPLEIFGSHPADVYDAVTDAVMRGELAIYKLPQLDATNCVRGNNAQNTGLCFVRGPAPHCATKLKPEPIASIEAAKALLDELGISEKLFLGELAHKGLYNSHQQREPMQTALKMLASGEILTYKIPMPPMAKPPKPVEYEDTSGPGYQPVPMAPEPSAASETKSVPSKPAQVESAKNSEPAQSIDECEQRLAAARVKLDKQGYQAKYTDEQQLEKVGTNEVSKERFLVSFQTQNADDGAKLAFQRDSGLAPVWATSFDQLENADTDPQLIADILGTPYDPSKEYVLHIIDRGENLDQFGQNTLVPTWDNMQGPTQKYLGGKHESKILAEVMTPEYQKRYAEDIRAYKGFGLGEFNDADQQFYAESLPPAEEIKFMARHDVRREIGANSEFTGNGLTQSREPSTQFGVVETLTLENNPPSINKMKNVKTIPLKPRGATK